MRYHLPSLFRRQPRHAARRRGMALLLVMIGLIVCTILTAGFLATQGTSIGIARNERDASKSRDIAQTGIDMCYWLIKNRSDWRTGMTPGSTWLSNTPVGDGTVTVTVDKEFTAVTAPAGGTYNAGASTGAAAYVSLGSSVTSGTVVCRIGSTQVQAGVAGTIAKVFCIDGQSASLNQTLFLVKPAAGGSFADDTTQGVTLTSVGNYDNHAYTLLATVHPTGGGKVFYNGNYISGKITLGNSSFLTTAVIDSFNSTVAAYSAASPGTNASFSSGSTAAGALTVYWPSPFRGSYTAAPTSVLGTVISLLGAAGPSSTSTATEGRTPGNVIFPNTSGLGASRGALSKTNGIAYNLDTPGVYDDLTITGTTVNVTTSGTYSVNNLGIGNSSTSILNIPDGKTVNLIVRGVMVLNTGKITLNTTGVLNIYAAGNVTITSATINNNGGTSRFTLLGSTAGGSITMNNSSAALYGSIYAPQHSVTLQNSSPKLYGAIIAQTLTVKDSAQFHFDEALRSLRISPLTGGSAAPSSADYSINILGGAGVIR